MYSPETIVGMADEAARKAARVNATPYVPWSAGEVAGYGVSRLIPFPNLGSHRPQGWTLIEHRMVDAFGGGSESEPALTHRGLREWITEHLTDRDTYGNLYITGYAIIEVGQFQVVIGRFRRDNLRG